MFTVEELKAKGAKRAVLEYIVSQDPLIPVPETVEEKDIGPGVIIRSDHWREFESFYGIFESILVGEQIPTLAIRAADSLKSAENIIYFRKTGIPEIDAGTKPKKLFKKYCNARGLDAKMVLSELRTFPQRFVNSEITGTVIEHPNQPDSYLYYFRSPKNRTVLGFLLEYRNGQVIPLIGENETGRFPHVDELINGYNLDMGKMARVVELFRTIKKMPKFQDEFSYMMEFTDNPLCVLQLRRFRQLDDGRNITCDWADEKEVIATDLGLGTTTSEGIALPYFNGTVYPEFGPIFRQWNRASLKFDKSHPNGYAFECGNSTQYITSFFYNARAALGGKIAHTIHHGGMDNLANLSLFLFYTKNSEMLNDVRTGTILRIFSNGRQGYVKIER